MAFTLSRNSASQAGKMFHKSVRFTSTKQPSLFATNSKFGQMSRAITRSMWNMCNTHGASDNIVTKTAKNIRWPDKPCSCGCAGLHTEADKNLADFLTTEIQTERELKAFDKQPTIEGFDFSSKGAIGSLTKSAGDEVVKVTFNVNHSVEFEGGEDPEADGQMRSYPDFTVELSKPGSPTVAIQCSYTTDEMEEEGEMNSGEDDLFLIDEMYIQDGGDEESTYRVGSEVMQGDMYDHVISVLSSRGINNQFAEQLSDLASSYEHSEYIKFLEALKKTVS